MQFLEPVSDIANATWTLSGGSSVFDLIDETIAATDGDTTWIQSNVLSSTFTVALSAGAAPSDLSQVVISVRCRRAGTAAGFGTCSIELLEGATVRSSSTISPTAATYATRTWTVSSTDAATIVDWTNLRIRMTVTVVQANFRISTIELSMPDASAHALAVSAGSFSLTGIGAAIKSGRKATATVATFSLTGVATGLRSARTIASGTGSFSLAGVAVALKRGAQVAAGTGSFSLTGNATGLRAARSVVAGTGPFALSGVAVALKRAALLGAGAGSFTVTGNSTGLRRDARLASSVGSFALSGSDAALRAQRLMQIAAGSFSFTGQDASFGRGRAMPASTGVFTLSGADAALINARRLGAGTGSFSLTGVDAAVLRAAALRAVAATFALSGSDTSFVCARVLQAGTGLFVLTGNPIASLPAPSGGICSLLTVTDAVVSELNATPWPFAFETERVFQDTIELEQLDTLSVLVRCVKEVPKRLTRAKTIKGVVIDICVRIRPTTLDNASVDPYVEFLSAIRDHFDKAHLVDIPEAIVTKAIMKPAYSEPDLSGKRQYTGLVRLEVMDWR